MNSRNTASAFSVFNWLHWMSEITSEWRTRWAIIKSSTSSVSMPVAVSCSRIIDRRAAAKSSPSSRWRLDPVQPTAMTIFGVTRRLCEWGLQADTNLRTTSYLSLDSVIQAELGNFMIYFIEKWEKQINKWLVSKIATSVVKVLSTCKRNTE